MTRKSVLMLAAAFVLGAGGLAVAQPGPSGMRGGAAPAPIYDPAQLPEVKGQVAQYSLTPRGLVTGLILADGTEVHVSPHVATQLVFAVKPGDAVTIHGLKARALPMVVARSIKNDATGAMVLVTAPQHGRHGGTGAALEAEGRVAAVLHEPRGEPNGVRLEDGTLVRMPPAEAKRLAELLSPGKTVVVRGQGYSGPLGRVIAAMQVGPDKDNLTQVAAPRAMQRRGMQHGEHRGHGRKNHDGMGQQGMNHQGMGHPGMGPQRGQPGRPMAPAVPG